MKIKRKLKRKLNAKYCECSCGQEIVSNRRFVMGHFWIGRKHSDEIRKKMSLAHIGIPLSEERKRKIGLGNKSKKLSEEHKAALLKANIGRKHTDEAKRKNAIAHIGKKSSEETKRRISESNTGKKRSKEFKKRMSIIALNRSKELLLKIAIANIKGKNDGYCDAWADNEFKQDCRKDYCECIDYKNHSKQMQLHHVNLDKKDCRPNNLMILCASCHISLHRRLYNINDREKSIKEDFITIIKENKIIYIHNKTQKQISLTIQ